TRYRLTVQTRLKYLPPERLYFIGGNACIHNRPAIAVFEQPEIDVVELEGKRHAHPENAGCDLHHFSRTWHPLERVVQIFTLNGSLGNIGHERSRQGAARHYAQAFVIGAWEGRVKLTPPLTCFPLRHPRSVG